MIIRCVKCKEKFEQKNNERNCGCRPKVMTEKQKNYYKIRDDGFFRYLSSTRRYFQHPIYQWYKEFISSEDDMPHNRKCLIQYVD